jgi:NADPH:quinone reductase-like Zn-dependent oxidoreductase
MKIRLFFGNFPDMENSLRVRVIDLFLGCGETGHTDESDCLSPLRFTRCSSIRLMIGVLSPKDPRLGADVAGTVEAVGRYVTQFRPGDEVFGTCKGAFAENACASEATLAIKPENVTFEHAACGGIAAFTALQGLRDKGQIHLGQKLLINGAAGGVGTFAVQIAKSFGADVTGVCSTRNVEMVRSLGADRVIDYTRENFTESVHSYDVIFDCVGNCSFSACRRVLVPKGAYIEVGASTGRWMIAPMARSATAPAWSRLVGQKYSTLLARSNRDDLNIIGGLMASRKVTPVIDRALTLREIPDAIRYVEEGHARGKVVISMDPATMTNGKVPR